MAIREKVSRLFRTRSNKSNSETSSKSSSQSSVRDRWPSNVYKPGEPMPRLKYRATPKKEHKEKLEAFTFADSGRRKSFHSQYSPMGTRCPSRRNSWVSLDEKSMSDSHASSIMHPDLNKPSVSHIEHAGMSQSYDHHSSPDRSLLSTNWHPSPRVGGTAHDHHLFTESDFTFALQRSHMTVSAHA